MDYLDFDLHLSSAPNGYRVRATNAQGANASADFVLPFAAYEIENLFLRVGRPRRGVRKIESLEMKAAKEFGGKLFDAVFTGEVFGMWRSSLNAAAQQNKGVRLRLRLSDAPELGDLPWEFLYDKTLNRFIALHTKTPVVRYLDLPTPIQPLKIELPLRVLVMIADASDYDALDVEREWNNLQAATQNLQTRGVLTLERLDQATPMALRRALRQTPYHILHFIGHGAFDANEQDGVLIFKNELGRGQRVSSQTLGQLLANFESLRLVVLNACEGARTSRTDPFAGVAPGLVQQDIPAVIAMQFEVSDEAALTFAAEFYSALADGEAVDAALAHARSTILTDVNDLEWGTSVLYMRAPNGVIFDLKSAPVPPVKMEARPLAIEPKPETPRPVITPEPQTSLPSTSPARFAAPILEPTQATEPPKLTLPLSLQKLPRWQIVGIGALVGLLLLAGDIGKFGTDNAEMVFVPAGEFTMGSRDTDKNASADQKPAHRVALDAFWIDRYEVTNAHFKLCVDAGKCQPPNSTSSQTHNSYFGNVEFDNYPVIDVLWNDADAYCKWAKKRLPREAEWEKAARGTDGWIYPWGDTFEQSRLNSNNVVGDTKQVGNYPSGASPYGALDMAGNVWEWVADWYDENYYKSSPAQNPTGPASGQRRVLRGYAWYDTQDNVRAAYRYHVEPDYRDYGFGFRCARSFS